MGDRKVRIRPATRADAPRIAATHVASWRESYVGLVPDAMLSSLSVEGPTAMWMRILGEPRIPAPTDVYVAERGDEITGFGSCGAQRTGDLKDQGYDAEVAAVGIGGGRKQGRATRRAAVEYRHDNGQWRGFHAWPARR